MPRKTKSRGGVVFRPSRRSKSSKLCSPRHGTDTNGAVGKKCPTKIRPVQKRQISVSTNNRARLNHCMGRLYQNNPEWQVISETLKVRGHAAIFLFTSHQTSHYFCQHA